MNELIFIFVLLLPVAWYFGFRNGRKNKLEQNNSYQQGLSKTYFTGLNYLLNEESDKAIDSFVSMLEIDSETVETHLALGNLFRKRGEVNRAIRIHQNLIARPSLTSENRKSALLELGFDYMGAGLLDRAENIFKELINDSHFKNASLSQLLIIYQQTKDWKKAIETAGKLQKPMSDNIQKEISHFYCELAEEAVKKEQYKIASESIKKALNIDSDCVRANLINAEIHYSNAQYKKALKSYKALVKYDIDFLPEAINTLTNCYLQLNDNKGLLMFLTEAIEKGAGISSILAYAEILQADKGDREAADYIAQQMEMHPSIKGLLQLIELHIKHASENAKPSLQMLRGVVSKLLINKPIYHCVHCGFDSKTLFWKCPSCQSWGTVKPIQGIEGE